MYGVILRLDAARQQRIGGDYLSRLIPKTTLKKIESKLSRLNSSSTGLMPFAPTLMRPSFYPEFFRATDVRTLFWKLKLYNGLHGLTRVFVDENSRVVFEFDKLDEATVSVLDSVLKGYGHFEFTEPKQTKTQMTYSIRQQAGECNA